MDLRRHLRSLALLFFILATYFSTALARHHRIRHNHHRHKRQHSATTYLPNHFVLDGEGPEYGDWSAWSEPSPCSRSCGGGAAHQWRQCASLRPDGSEACSGAHKRYFSCNIQDCSPSGSDFRAEQCAEFNAVPFEGRNYEWIPYTKAPNKCELNCMPRGERFYYRHKRKVVDGTKCEEDKLDSCVDGKCLPVGCDNILGSPAREDKCRECGGDSSSCNTVDGILEDNDLQVGYNDIFLIPAGATNIRVYEVEKSNNYLAIRNESGHYYLNGNWRIDFPRSLKFAGTTFHYERQPHGFFAPEKVVALGPTTENLYIVLLYQGVNPGVRYEYSIPENVALQTSPDSYNWITDNFGECSTTCGAGTRTRNVMCARRKDLAPADDDLCDPGTQPERVHSCNLPACPASWAVGSWGACSEPCGTAGLQIRQVFCEKIGTSGLPTVAGDDECVQLVGPKPETEQECNVGLKCPQWHEGPWKPCDHLCGEGMQKRKVTCYTLNDEGKKEVLEDSECSEKPEDSKECMMRPCEGVDWVASKWSGCEDKCDLTQETRKVYCANQAGKVYPDKWCQQKRLPTLVQDCKSPVACEFQWYAAQWSKCSAQCGAGVQTRKVFCGSFEEDNIKKVEDEKCDAAEKYNNTKDCAAKAECTGEWFSGPWSGCSKACGAGVMSRKVICLLNNATVAATNCDPSLTVFSSEPCNTHACSEDQIMPVEPEKITTVSEEEECEEEDEESSFITMDTTLGLAEVSVPVTTVSTSTDESSDATGSSISGMTEDELLLSTTSVDSSMETSSSSVGLTEQAASSKAEYTASSSSDDTDEPMLSDSTYMTSDAGTGLTTSSDEVLTTSGSASMETSLDGETGSGDDSPTTIESGSTSSGVEESSSSDGAVTTDVSSTEEVTGSDMTTSSDGSSSSDMTSSSEASSTSDETTTDITSTSDESTTDISSTSEGTMESTDMTSVDKDVTSSEAETSSSAVSVDYSTAEASSDHDYPSEVGPKDLEATGAVQTTDGPASVSETSEEMTTMTSEGTSEGSDGTTESSESTGSGSELSSERSVGSTDSSVGSTDLSSEVTEISTTMETATGSDGTSDGSSVATEDMWSSTVTSMSGLTTEADEWMTGSSQSSVELAITKEHFMRKCKPRKRKECEKSEFGCCPDGVTDAEGPFSKGCPMPMTCSETKHGCCPDGVSPAKGSKNKGCPPSLCGQSLFGCCQDGSTAAEGNDNEGCPIVPDETDVPFNCSTTEFGCCPDMILSASGLNFEGCYVCEGSGDCESCNDTKFGCCADGVKPATGPDMAGCEEEEGSGGFTSSPERDCSETKEGCCPDGKTAAKGPNFKGCAEIDFDNCTLSYFGCCPTGETPALGPNFEECRMPCETEAHGCCSDGITPAHGPNLEGCCLNSAYGCCPDNILPAQGPNLEGCGCQYSRYGCCPDKTAAARGPNKEGCGCQYTPHGCCPNKYTPAAGPDFEGCPCYTYQFGCCPDGEMVAKGPQGQGCGCENTEFGCCSDEKTRALGPEGAGCGCEASKFGCCLDGIVEAQGDNFEGCDSVPSVPGASCTQVKDRGSCRNFTVKWFFDMEYGGCSRFWYGGCEGNDNRFKSQDECKATCIEPPGRDACHLPKVEGPCEGYYPSWYYDSDRKQCGQFIYGGCLGNNNRFQTIDECQGLCVTHGAADACDQPKHEGPCQGNSSRWHFDAKTKVCQEFTYGGCKANQNNFPTETSCVQKCLQPGRSRDLCALPREAGTCTERLPKWFFDASENRCMPFYYTGCEGNANRFDSQETCMADCPPRVEQDSCTLPALAGECHNYTERWYYDSYEVRCRQFYYGGCGGNKNNFASQRDCENRCERGEEPTQPPAAEVFSAQSCFLPDEHGPCSESKAQWFYDSRDGVCKQFLYGGCEGNSNRFATRADCEISCGNVQDLCNLPVVVGPCSGTYQQYYYDRNTDSCHEFDYGGCQGNANKFNDERECEERCRRGGPALTTAGPDLLASQPPRSYEEEPSGLCLSRVDPGPCNEDHPAWHYDEQSRSCQAFIYGGCGGNANRFDSEEQCERQCGEFRGLDVCNMPSDIGPCRGSFRKYFFDRSSGSCQEFVYGGCVGNSNRFSTIEECESVCLHREEALPSGNDTINSHQAICRLRPEQGPCSGGSYERWYYDPRQRTCIPFNYGGCAGNYNRFKNFRTCLDFCTYTDPRPDEVERERQPEVRPPVEPERGPNEIDVDSPPTKIETSCKAALDECSRMRCPYGVERYVDAADCERCRCHDVCKDHVCPEGTRCATDLYQNVGTGNTEFRAICREVTKPGQCPTFAPGSATCVRECNSDADCRGEGKCCQHDCGSSCVTLPTEEDRRVTAAPPYRPVDTYDPRRGEAPRIMATEPVVSAMEGTYATLPCIAKGNPPPSVTWRKGSVTFDASGPRHKMLLDGSLQMIGLTRSDAGDYRCSADNGVGQPAERDMRLEVTDPVSKPAEIVGEPNTYVVATIGISASLQCYAIGYPRPIVTWWRGDRLLPLTSELFEQRRDFSLLIRSVTLRNLGAYTCQAYNGLGKAASWSVTVQAIGPVYSTNPEDFPFLQYLVTQPRRPENDTVPDRQRPSYPYRPVRPPPETPVGRPAPAPQPPPPYVPPYVPEERQPPDTPRVLIVPVEANITAEQTHFSVDSDISLPCSVDGYPIPRVSWYKNEVHIEPSERIQITENHRLLIHRASSNDIGSYRCEASNQYGSSSSSISITVEGVYVHPNCTDNPFFANCQLIVQAQYCTHKYYARFCCRTCTQAGQLPSFGPHLDGTGTHSQSPSRK